MVNAYDNNGGGSQVLDDDKDPYRKNGCEYAGNYKDGGDNKIDGADFFRRLFHRSISSCT